MSERKKKPTPDNYEEIIEYVCNELRAGARKSTIFKQAKKKYDINAPIWQYNIIPDVYKKFHEDMDVYACVQKEVQIQRLEELYKEAKKKGQMQNAIKALNEMNRILGISEQKLNVNAEIEYKLEI